MKLHERLDRVYALRITRVLKDVLLCLAYHCNSKDECWPGMRLLSRESAVPLKRIPDCVTGLEQLGLLAIMAGNSHRANRYFLKLPSKSKSVHPVETLRSPRGYRTVQEQPKLDSVVTKPKQPKLGRMQCADCLRISHDLDDKQTCSACRSRYRKAEAQAKVLPFPAQAR